MRLWMVFAIIFCSFGALWLLAFVSMAAGNPTAVNGVVGIGIVEVIAFLCTVWLFKEDV